MLVPSSASTVGSGGKLKIGVVLSGGQAPGGHNVICGIYDYLQDRVKGSTLYGFGGGPAGIMKCKYVELTSEYVYPYRNQGGFDMICSGRDKIKTLAEETAVKLDLYGLVVIGCDDSNTNACLLAENFRSKNLKTRVIGCPKTIDGDLKCKEVPVSFGFDTACKIYSEMIGNVMVDARSTGKYYHFVRLMGRAASHITLECALHVTIIGEEVAAKRSTLKNVTEYIVDVICKRAVSGYNYGVILIPEGLIDFIPEVQQLISELNEILAHDVVDEGGLWKKKLAPQSLELFEFLPQGIREQLMLERDPHGNMQVAKIETEKMLIQMVETELEKRNQEGTYIGNFRGQSHFFGYEGRCGLPTNFDSTYCYALGYAAAALLQSGKTGLISSVGNVAAPVSEWTIGGTALTSLMDVERRHGKFKPVIKKAMVELEGVPFKKFESLREEWAVKNFYISPGPIQFVGPASDAVNPHSSVGARRPCKDLHINRTDSLGVIYSQLLLIESFEARIFRIKKLSPGSALKREAPTVPRSPERTVIISVAEVTEAGDRVASMMTAPGRITRDVRSWLARATLSRSYQALPPPPPPYHHLLAQRTLERLVLSEATEVDLRKLVEQDGRMWSLLPAGLAGIFGAGSLQMAYADASEGIEASVSSPPEGWDMEQIAKHEQARVRKLLSSKGQPYGSIPRFSVAVKGQRVSFKFQVPPACEVSQIIATLASKLGVKAEEPNGGSDMLLRGWDSTVAWQLTLNPLERPKKAIEGDNHESVSKVDGDLCIFIFRSLISKDKAEVEFMKSGSLSMEELEAFVLVLQLAGESLGREHRDFQGTPRGGDSRKTSTDKTIASLESMGVRIYGLDQPQVSSRDTSISWGNIAGYDKQKREIEDTVLLALKRPDIYDDIARGTRQKFESNRPRAVLFEGPPGTGKTSCARVIATQAGVPLLYVPLEIVMSKYYGESERLLGQVFSLANELPGGGIIFLDEVDSFAVTRDNEIHEATRRVLSVLLRQIDGFEQDKKVVVIAATNRKQDLDPALISRFDSMITFGLPDLLNREEIAAQYAKHLKQQELAEFARATEEMSGRDIRDVCQQAERSWASKIIRGEENNKEQVSLPPLKEYIERAVNRRNALLSIADEKSREAKPHKQKLRLDLS